MLKKFVLLVSIPLLSLFISCKCTNLDCPGLAAKYVQMIPYNPGDTIKFVNDAGDELFFTSKFFNISEPVTIECYKNGMGGCKCGCPETSGNSSFITPDSSRKILNTQGAIIGIYNFMGMAISQAQENPVPDIVKLNYSIFDQYNNFYVDPVIKVNTGDSLISSFTAGTLSYSNVVYHETDTIVVPGKKYFVLKSYYSVEKGIVAFYDLQTQSLFYRKP